MELRYIIIKVNEMDRAKNFYSELTGKTPEMDGNRMAKYRFNGIKIGLYNPEADGEKSEVQRGDSVIPAFGVENFEEALEKVRGLTEIRDEKEIDGHRWFTFRDSEGNLLEIHER
ncbi:VOC family protein [Candidatus Nanosalina sp. VS9-1]|uniref:VOC family protein n=1 Tax=Candidatus Nanosalina sp. VS9-1 TaxID=3388566 RepID=UPI0039DFF47E